MALARVNPQVLVSMSLTLSHLSLVTCLATRECLDWITGNSPDILWLFGPLVEVNQAIKGSMSLTLSH